METQKYVTSSDYDVLDGQTNVQYEYETYCDREFALAKMDAITNYLNLRYFREEKIQMGFVTPKN